MKKELYFYLTIYYKFELLYYVIGVVSNFYIIFI